MQRATDVLAEACAEFNLIAPYELPAPGDHCRIDDVEKPGRGDGFLAVFSDNLGFWICNNRRQEIPGKAFFFDGNVRRQTEQQKRDARRFRDRNRAREEAEWNQAAQSAAYSWANAHPVSADHPYLVRKGVQFATDCIRQLYNAPMDHPWLVAPVLLVPMMDWEGKVWSLQYIDCNGKKRPLTGGRKRDNFVVLNRAAWDRDVPIYFAEGFVTAATVAMATGAPCVCAFDCGNLPKVAKIFRDHVPDRPFVICADNDGTIDKDGQPKENAGVVKGEEAARLAGGWLAIPEFYGQPGTDFNDLASIPNWGLDAVSKCITEARDFRATSPVGAEWLDGDALPEICQEWGEDHMARAFVRLMGDRLRYVKTWGAWMQYGGGVWTKEETEFAFDAIGELCSHVAATRPDIRNRSALHKAPTRSNVEKIARAKRSIVAVANQWDVDPWLLNTPGGIVDLKTGQLLPHDPTKYLTHQTTVSPGGPCFGWMTFLSQIFQNDAELIGYIQRLIGYAITGMTNEQKLVFFYGAGRNGKGTLLDIIEWVLSSYHKTAASETFTESRNERHPCDLADLRGARLVTAQEIEGGKMWAESRIKTLTGQDTVKARFMRGDLFEYRPNYQIIISANNKPRFSVVDAAIRGRLQLVPFLRIFLDHEQDKTLDEKLKAEAGGILQWMIEGCLAWQRYGLCPPQSVVAATKDYLDAEDLEGQWIEQNCFQHVETETALSVLFQDWCNFASRLHGRPKRDRDLSDRLVREGFVKKKTKHGAAFVGIGLDPNRNRTMGTVVNFPFNQAS